MIGERRGGDALASRSLSGYLVFRIGDDLMHGGVAEFGGNAAVRFEYTVISNLYAGGLPPAEAAGVIIEKVGEILAFQAAGNRLEALLKATNPPLAALHPSLETSRAASGRSNAVDG